MTTFYMLMPPIVVTPTGVQQIHKDLDINKSTSPGVLSPRILKELANDIAQ